MISRLLKAGDARLVRWISVCAAASLLAFSGVREMIALLTSPIILTEPAIYAFSIPMTLIGTIVPILALSWLAYCVMRRMGSEPSLWKALRLELDRNSVPAGLTLFLWLILSPITLVFENFIALSVVPLTTPVCCLLAVGFSCWMFRQVNAELRVTIIAWLLLSILATEYIDWNPRKSMMRDLYRIRE